MLGVRTSSSSNPSATPPPKKPDKSETTTTAPPEAGPEEPVTEQDMIDLIHYLVLSPMLMESIMDEAKLEELFNLNDHEKDITFT